MQSARPYESSKNIEGQTPLICPLGAGTNWYKSFSPDHFGQSEMNDSTMLCHKTSTA